MNGHWLLAGAALGAAGTAGVILLGEWWSAPLYAAATVFLAVKWWTWVDRG